MAEIAEMPESLHSLSFEDNSVDSEAQLVVSDFLDYTEYLPSDIIRSFTLIRQLDKAYLDAAARVHELTRQYGKLPELPAAQRPNVKIIRRDIAGALDKALTCRQAAAAEASRINEVVKRHQVRLSLIKTKLQALPKPPSRETTLAPVSPALSKVRPAEEPSTLQQKRRKRKSLVLEDLPPAEVDVETWNQQEVDVSPKNYRADTRAGSARTPKTPAITRTRAPKTPKERRLGPDGQPLHHRVSVISTTNALALLAPPPENALPGSKYRPWLKLTEYELAIIRKTMKKNVTWVPSSHMITTYLSAHERGPENYQIAKAIAESTGEPLLDEEPESKDLAALSGRPDGDDNTDATQGTQLQPDAGADADANADENELPLPSQAETKAIIDYFTTTSRPRTRRATQDAMPMDEINKKMYEVSQSMKTIFHQPPTPSAVPDTPGISTRADRKRKRAAVKDGLADSPSIGEAKVDNKRLKTGNVGERDAIPIRSPVHLPDPDVRVLRTTTTVPLAPEGASLPPPSATMKSNEAEAVEHSSSRRKSADAGILHQTAAHSRPKRTSGAQKVIDSPSIDVPAQFEASRVSRSSTRSGGTASIKAASAEPAPSKRETREPRRFSGNDDTIQPAPATSARTTRRRPIPGIVAAEDDGKDNVSIGPRKSKPKARRKSDSGKVNGTDVDETQYRDPNEPTYCVCNDVSYGVMIACENDKCERAWFHLECVNLTEIPPRRTKWFCPFCRDKLHIDEKGNAAPVATSRRK